MGGEIGFVGLGQMGGGMARNLQKVVATLHIYDQRAESMTELESSGAVCAQNPAELAQRCQIIFLCLPFAPQVREALFGEQGIQSAGRSDLIIVDTTTLDRSDALAIGAQAAEQGIQYFDCPVSGLPARADAGTLTVMFGGDKDSFDELRHCLQAFGEPMYCGQLGSGQAMKAINNIIYDINITALCEVLPLAVAIGLDPAQLTELVTHGSSRSFAATHFVPRMLERQFSGDFALQDAYKDIVNIQKMGIETRASLPLVNAMTSTYQAALAAGYGEEPKSAMLKVYEKNLNVEFRKR